MELDPFILYHLPKESLRDSVEKPPYTCPDTFLIDGTFIGKYTGSLPDSYKELWMRHPFFGHILVSTYGRIRRDTPTGALFALPYREEKSMPGYWVVNDGNYDFFVYSLVAETWLLPFNPEPFKYRIVHHISNNGFVNIPGNLIYVTNAQHSYIHNRLPEGWEEMDELEAMDSQKKSLKNWVKRINSIFTLVPWETYLSLKKDYVQNRSSISPFSKESLSLFYSKFKLQ